MRDVLKSDLYRKLGYGGDVREYDAVLCEASLTNPRKTRISVNKVSQVESLLAKWFVRVCNRGDCKARAKSFPDARIITPSSNQSRCEVCGGSINRTAVDRMVGTCESIGWSKLCVVGGSPNTRNELAVLVDDRLELRLIIGTVSRTRTQADADLVWADKIVIWGQTELDHKVSSLYHGPHVILIAKKGIAELASAVCESAGRR
ncbi:MAG: hypothetical protein IIB55_07680 [Planctomycetes bacterium]|nr:hypothetical protein [Planctomycetota bacterium]MCH9058492.1 hypothetical protein [Planctomycetota bacterium]